MQKLDCYMSSEHMHCSKDWIKCIEHAAEMGFDGVELFALENGVNFTELPLERLSRIGAAAQRYGLALSVHPWVNWAALPLESLKSSCHSLFDRCGVIRAREVNMHMEFLTDRAAGLDRLFEATDACLPDLKERGITLYYENVPPQGVRMIGSEIADFDALFEHYRNEPAVMMNIDSGHAHIAGILRTLSQKHGSRWKYTHVHDNEGIADQHLAPGDGTIDFDSFAASAARSQYSGPLMMEYNERGLEKGMRTLRRAYESAGYSLSAIRHSADE